MGRLQGESFRKGMKLDDSVEKDAVFIQRTVQFWDKILLPSVQEIRRDSTSSNILVVSHGGFISMCTELTTGHMNTCSLHRLG